jgi:hypothetical protein
LVKDIILVWDDSLNIVETVIRPGDKFLEITDSININETNIENLGKKISDDVDLEDSINYNLTLSLSDVVYLEENPELINEYFKSEVDNVDITENSNRLLELTKSDTIEIIEMSIRKMGANFITGLIIKEEADLPIQSVERIGQTAFLRTERSS